MAKKTSAPATTVHEKRVYPRRTLRTQVIFEDESGEGFIYFYSTDVSMGGIFLESDIPLKVGTRVFLSFALHDGEAPIRVIGRVVRVERETAESLRIVGMGVQFSDLPDAAQKILLAYITS